MAHEYRSAMHQFMMFLADHGKERIKLATSNMMTAMAAAWIRCADRYSEPRIKNLLQFRRDLPPSYDYAVPLSYTERLWLRKDDPAPIAILRMREQEPGARHPSSKQERLFGRARLQAILNPAICTHRTKDVVPESSIERCRDCGQPIFRRKLRLGSNRSKQHSGNR